MKAVHSTQASAGTPAFSRKDPRILVLDIIIGALALLVVVLTYSFVHRVLIRPPVDPARSGPAPAGIIQLDVLNGCGASGAGITMTSYLRARGFDVVEIRNYKSFDVAESMVIDRAGNRANAEKVAYALGVDNRHIIQQINQDYFVDVSVVIGRDYATLKPSQ